MPRRRRNKAAKTWTQLTDRVLSNMSALYKNVGKERISIGDMVSLGESGRARPAEIDDRIIGVVSSNELHSGGITAEKLSLRGSPMSTSAQVPNSNDAGDTYRYWINENIEDEYGELRERLGRHEVKEMRKRLQELEKENRELRDELRPESESKPRIQYIIDIQKRDKKNE